MSLNNSLADILRTASKVIWHWLTGKCEIERACQNQFHDQKMSYTFAISLKKSKKLSTFSKIIFFPKPFKVSQACDSIISIKKIPKTELLIISNISHCLRSLRFVNSVITKIQAFSKMEFDKSREEHIRLIESFWANMKPGLSRRRFPSTQDVDDGFKSIDWGDVGFQGSDPSTDFRGMGLLGLLQLEYFSQRQTKAAVAVLGESTHPRRYYPFAATGINVTAFVRELLTERRLHRHLFSSLDIFGNRASYSFEEGPSESDELVELGCQAIHDIYCEIFIEFNKLWTERDPDNIFAFQEIFGEIKKRVRDRMPPLE